VSRISVRIATATFYLAERALDASVGAFGIAARDDIARPRCSRWPVWDMSNPSGGL
jgi:hypothetical protein